VSFESGLNSAQIYDFAAGDLYGQNVSRGGPQFVATQPYYPGVNDSLGGDPHGQKFNPNVFTVYAPWQNSRDRQQASIARGEQIFNTQPLTISDVPGLTTGTQTIAGTCTTCHDTPNVGDHSLPLPLDVGAIAGQFQDSSYVYHGFVRNWDGSFATFDAPGAGTSANQGTLAFDINPVGMTAGVYIDASNVYHGFVRSRNDFATFDPTGSVFTYVCEETCLKWDGTVAGFYYDSSFISHGFVREVDGTITSFDAPSAAFGTVAASINAAGIITGYSVDSNLVAHGFLRYPDGSFTTYDDPDAGAGTTPPQGTYPFSISFGGATTGQYFDASGNGHGFERFPDGRFANFDAPHAAPGSAAGTRPSTNNFAGEVAGWYVDVGGLNHGFLWVP
jgi:hypothetical protein